MNCKNCGHPKTYHAFGDCNHLSATGGVVMICPCEAFVPSVEPTVSMADRAAEEANHSFNRILDWDPLRDTYTYIQKNTLRAYFDGGHIAGASSVKSECQSENLSAVREAFAEVERRVGTGFGEYGEGISEVFFEMKELLEEMENGTTISEKGN